MYKNFVEKASPMIMYLTILPSRTELRMKDSANSQLEQKSMPALGLVTHWNAISDVGTRLSWVQTAKKQFMTQQKTKKLPHPISKDYTSITRLVRYSVYEKVLTSTFSHP